MTTSTYNFCAGFSVVLEHLLPYETMKEKSHMPSPPITQLGGGAWNIIKTLEQLDQKLKLELVAFVGSDDVEREVLHTLVSKDTIPTVLLGNRERTKSSYYLLPQKGETWAFGDPGGKITKTEEIIQQIAKHGENSDVRILAEVSADPQEIACAKTFFKKVNDSQMNVLIPSVDLIESGKIGELSPDLVVINEHEAKVLFQKEPTEEDVLNHSLGGLCITRGAGVAWLKYHNSLYRGKPQEIQDPKYVGGAGDATTAALVYALWYQKKNPQEALDFALTIGTSVLSLPTSYYVHT